MGGFASFRFEILPGFIESPQYRLPVLNPKDCPQILNEPPGVSPLELGRLKMT
jgi:hypothetical protein